MFRKAVKKILELTVKPLVVWHLRKPRRYIYKGLKLEISPGVFHPGYFNSTLMLAGFLEGTDLAGKRFLEVGCGSGLLSLIAARLGAEVTAFDINADAVTNTAKNTVANNLNVNVLQSDLFDKLEISQYDYIVINPPYYPRNASDESQLAWYCGNDYQYFKKLFRTIGNYYHSNSVVLMILSEDCDIQKIKNIALQNSQMLLLKEKRKIRLEDNYIFSIHKLEG